LIFFDKALLATVRCIEGLFLLVKGIGNWVSQLGWSFGPPACLQYMIKDEM